MSEVDTEQGQSGGEEALLRLDLLPGIARRWTRRSEINKGIGLTSADLDVLNAIGVGELISSKAAEVLRNASKVRLEERMPKPRPILEKHVEMMERRAAEIWRPKGGRR